MSYPVLTLVCATSYGVPDATAAQADERETDVTHVNGVAGDAVEEGGPGDEGNEVGVDWCTCGCSLD